MTVHEGVAGWTFETVEGWHEVTIHPPAGSKHATWCIDHEGSVVAERGPSEESCGYRSGAPESRYIPIAVITKAIEIWHATGAKS